MPRQLLPFLLGILLLPALAAAQEEPIALADDPFEITDPNAAPPGSAELAIIGAYERARRGRSRDTLATDTELAIGVVRGLEFRIGQTGAYGNLETRRRLGNLTTGEEEDNRRPYWGGATQLGALVQLSEERGAMPAIGLLGRLRNIYGPDRPNYETEVVALIGRTLRRGNRPLGAHLNLGLVSRLAPKPGERPNRYVLNASVGQAVTADTALVVSYVREQQERGSRDFSLVQAGLRHRLPDGRTVLGLAAGFGTNRDSPRFEIAFALQWQLSDGWY
ncbi:hypothetical protein [Roseicella aquatilis]|uniref:Transporter n=1 Tax=Roseicella aquatilis TaxID=2527868 RepID=A0A4R4D918_9PROT|nr:hypothetical protein [Roseicella aquatilis]TCZ56275.1 hypothetical protein EXY23_20040 [Roseicella aquatilis]